MGRVFENMVRIGRSIIPLQSGLTVFFAIMIIDLIVILEPRHLSSAFPLFVLALVINIVSLGLFTYENLSTQKIPNLNSQIARLVS